MPEHLKDVPFAPFSKGDKLGKAADWTQQAYQRNQGAFLPTAAAAAAAYAYAAWPAKHVLSLVVHAAA